MKKFEVWTEGYAASPDRGEATFHGTVEAENFDQACIEVLGDDLDKDPETKDGYRRSRDGRLSVWACRCFDNETDARRSFG